MRNITMVFGVALLGILAGEGRACNRGAPARGFSAGYYYRTPARFVVPPAQVIFQYQLTSVPAATAVPPPPTVPYSAPAPDTGCGCETTNVVPESAPTGVTYNAPSADVGVSYSTAGVLPLSAFRSFRSASYVARDVTVPSRTFFVPPARTVIREKTEVFQTALPAPIVRERTVTRSKTFFNASTHVARAPKGVTRLRQHHVPRGPVVREVIQNAPAVPANVNVNVVRGRRNIVVGGR